MNPSQTRWLRRGVGTLIALGVAWAAVQAVWPNHVRDPNPAEIQETMQTMQTYCLGRFLVPLPRGSQVKIATSGIEANFWFKQKLSRFEFDRIVEKRWLALQQLTHDSNRDAYISPSTRSSPMEGAVIFTYEHQRVTLGSSNPDGDELHETEGYLWRDGHLFHFEPRLNWEARIIATMRSLQVREFETVPAEEGLCAAGSFSQAPARHAPVRLSAFPLIFQGIRRCLPSSGPTPCIRPSKSRGVRQASRTMPRSTMMSFKARSLRDRSRMVVGLTGEEHIAAATSKRGDKYRTSISARWHFPGEVGSITKPTINFGLGVSYESETEPSRWAHFPETDESGGDPEAHFMALWTAILDGAQLR